MADPNNANNASTARSLKFKPKKVDRRSATERSAAAHQIEHEQHVQARIAAAAAAPSTSWHPNQPRQHQQQHHPRPYQHQPRPHPDQYQSQNLQRREPLAPGPSPRTPATPATVASSLAAMGSASTIEASSPAVRGSGGDAAICSATGVSGGVNATVEDDEDEEDVVAVSSSAQRKAKAKAKGKAKPQSKTKDSSSADPNAADAAKLNVKKSEGEEDEENDEGEKLSMHDTEEEEFHARESFFMELDNHLHPRDVNHLDAILDDSDNDMEMYMDLHDSMYSPGPRLRPISLIRHEHVDRVKNLNTEATSAASARLRQQQQRQDERQAQKQQEENPTKQDDDPNANDTDEDIITVAPASSSRWTKRSASGRASMKPDPDLSIDNAGNGDGDVAMPDASVSGSASLPSPALAPEAEDDHGEGKRLRSDRAWVLDELGPPGLASPGGPSRDGQIYLFQLPPVLPNLIPASTSESALPGSSRVTAPNTISTSTSQAAPTNPTSSTTAPAGAGAATTPTPRRKGKQKAPIPPAPPAEKFIKEEDAKDDNPLHAPAEPSFTGSIGTLRVYSDGSALMSWGGLEHEVRKGVRGELLQEVLVTGERGEQSERIERSERGERSERAAQAQGEKQRREKGKGRERDGEAETETEDGGEGDDEVENGDAKAEVEIHKNPETVPAATAVGQVRGAFVVTPGWAQLLERAAG